MQPPRHVWRTDLCYEVWPDWAITDDKRVQVGFELDLCGTCESAMGAARFDELRHIAESVAQADSPDVTTELSPYDSSIHQSSRRQFRPEVVLSIRILHRKGFDRPVDDAEEDCLQRVESRLKRLGIPRSH